MKTALALLVTLASIALISCRDRPTTAQVEAPTYSALKITLDSTQVNTSYPAILEGEHLVEIRSKIDGYIEEVYISEGQQVKAGQTLFKIDAESYREEVNNKNAAIRSAQAHLETETLKVEKLRVLVEKNIINQIELSSAQNIVKVRKAELQQAQADWASAQSKLNFTYIKSPIQGIVGRLPYKTGSLVSSSATQALTQIADTRRVYANFSLSQKQLNAFLANYSGSQIADKLRAIAAVTLLTAEGTKYPHQGKIEHLSGVLHTETGAANFKALFPNAEGLLWSGASATLVIPTRIKQAILIPKSAVFEIQGKLFVYKLDASHTTVTQEIQIAPYQAEKHYIASEGLSVDEVILTDGIGHVKAGETVQPNFSQPLKN